MSTWRILVTALLLIHPALCQGIPSTCEIHSVEAGENTTLTFHFGQDLRQEGVRDFSVEHKVFNSSASQTRLLDCEFSYGDVTCDKTSCCTWESHVTDVFRVYIHNVSQELEGMFWGFLTPASTEYQKFCNFSLKASTCRTDPIIATNSHTICTNQPVTIGQTCTVTCNPGHYFQENQTSVTYTCVGKNKWSPEMMVTACEDFSEQPKVQEAHGLNFLLLLLIVIPIAMIIFIFFIQARKREEISKDVEEHLLAKSEKMKDSTKDEADPLLTSAENYWLQCIKTWYPEFHSRSHFLPPLHFNQEKLTMKNIADKEVYVPESTQSNPRVLYDRALQRVLIGMHALADNGQEVMFVVSQLQFGNYLGEPSFAPAAARLPRPSTVPEDLLKQHFDKGDFDVLIIHSQHGLFTLQISSAGGDFSQQTMTDQEEDALIEKVNEVIELLNKAGDVLKHLTSNLKTEINITKCLVMPNITSGRLKRVIEMNPSTGQLLSECLGAKNIDDAMKLCLLKDQLADNQTPSDINLSSLQALREWWQHVRASRSGSLLTSSLYEQLVARFCGPATTVEVHCVTAPSLNITTLGEAVSETGERVARLVLFPQQVDILNQSLPRAFLNGPPGTGKTIVLIMQGLTWIQRGYDVHVVSTWYESHAATIVIEYQLQETAKTSTARSRVHRYQFDFEKDGEVKTAVSSLKSLSKGKQLCVIADEVVRDYSRKPFTEFCHQLINEVPEVFIWGASVYNDVRPNCLEEFKLTSPLRSPPVVREVMEAVEIKDKQVHNYTVSDFPVPTDGPPVMRIKHIDGQSDHTGFWPFNCKECGHQVARILKELDVGRKGDSNGPPPLQYGDVLVLCFCDQTHDWVNSNGQVITTANGLIQGLLDCHVPVRVVKKGDENSIRYTALGVVDLVTVANWRDVHGLERKVVVVERGLGVFDRLHAMSRCTSQLVVIDRLPDRCFHYDDDYVVAVKNNGNG